jgi:hypothetical protein
MSRGALTVFNRYANDFVLLRTDSGKGQQRALTP